MIVKDYPSPKESNIRYGGANITAKEANAVKQIQDIVWNNVANAHKSQLRDSLNTKMQQQTGQ